MAAISAQQRDLDAVRAGLRRWFAARDTSGDISVSPPQTNPTSGFSSESVLFDVTSIAGGEETTSSYVVRLAPLGGGVFPEYDFARQAATQNALAAAGVPAAAPALHEPDPSWLGSEFLLMPKLEGRIPSDIYPATGWLKDAERPLQRACYESFLDVLAALHDVEVSPAIAAVLARDGGNGLGAEIDWWARYLEWGTDGDPSSEMADAHAWVAATQPTADQGSDVVTWGDARFANAVFDTSGTVTGVLDLEQAAIGPAELDIGWWLATRRQTSEAFGVHHDPELPGFLDRAATIARVEAHLGRDLRSIEWHETFAMIRMGTCIVATQTLLRRVGEREHFMFAATPLPPWVRARIDRLDA